MNAFTVFGASFRQTGRQRGIALVLAACTLAPALAGAQSPWTVTVTPTLNPLPIGFCAAIHLAVRDASGTEARSPLGPRVTIADFDMTVTAPGARSVAGKQIDASHWSACACQGAVAGAVATVIATYPAQSLPAASRVPGVAFQTTATFTVGAAKGANPPACVAPPPAPANVPVQIPNFPDGAAEWAALQQSLGSSGWAGLQKEVDAFMRQQPDEIVDKPPPGAPNLLPGGRNRAWSGAIEYTYAQVTKLDKFESHGVVHIVDGRARWSGLAARREDHSAKGCPSIYSASSSGDGESDLVTIDYTSENPVTGIKRPDVKQGPGATTQRSPNVMLTIFPKTIFPKTISPKYGFAIELPLKGSGQYAGGGPACPGYKPQVREFNTAIQESGDGTFDPDNPDELSGTKTTTPFPGASMTMKWQFLRLNEDRGR